MVIDGYFTAEELENIKSEIKDLKRLAGSEITSKSGVGLKNGTGVFWDDLYIERQNSPLLVASRKLFSEDLIKELAAFDLVFKFIQGSNVDNCLVNYYAPGQMYKAHSDTARITALTLLGFGEFTGGGFSFPDQNIEIEFEQNRTIIFPSCVNHASIPLHGAENVFRVSIAQFVDRIKNDLP